MNCSLGTCNIATSRFKPCHIMLQDKKAAKTLRTEMKDADTNQDGMISFIEFLGYFQKMARYRADLARTQRLEAYGQPLDLPPSKQRLLHTLSHC